VDKKDTARNGNTCAEVYNLSDAQRICPQLLYKEKRRLIFSNETPSGLRLYNLTFLLIQIMKAI